MEGNTSKMIRLLSRIKSEMNGEAADYMQSSGLVYPLNYGVASATVRSIAKDFAPDHSLAELLYRQQVRELRLAAATVADPTKVNEANADFWKQGITTAEIAENLGSFLLSRSDAADSIARTWIESSNGNVRYCALITAVKAVRSGKIGDDTIEHIVKTMKDAADTPTLRSLGSLVTLYALGNEAKRCRIENLVRTEKTDCYLFLLQELSA